MSATIRRGDSAFNKVGKRVTAQGVAKGNAAAANRGGLTKGGHPRTTRQVTRGGEKV